MKAGKTLAALALTAVIVGGTAACDSSYNDPGYQDNSIAEYEYGQYNSSHVWIEFGTPKLVYVTPTYYRSHMYLYANPLHIHVTAPKGVTIGKSRTTTTTRGTRVTSGCNSCRPGGGGVRYGSGSRSTSGGSRPGRR